MSGITYAEDFTVIPSPVPHYGILQLAPGQGASGYGSKISTDRMVTFPGSSRRYRVYAVCYSNAASFYIRKGGIDLYLRDSDLT